MFSSASRVLTFLLLFLVVCFFSRSPPNCNFIAREEIRNLGSRAYGEDHGGEREEEAANEEV